MTTDEWLNSPSERAAFAVVLRNSGIESIKLKDYLQLHETWEAAGRPDKIT
jgi:hypothetical protein